jgi:hypothetical protein
VRFTAGASDVVLSNCHVHQSTGIRIEPGAARITLVNNHIHHNRAASVTIAGAREISIIGNRIHNDRGPALDMWQCQAVTVSRNRLSNYRPDEDGSGGEAIRVGAGCSDVSFDNNSVLEASTALRIEGNPERVAFRRGYMENQLTKESTALSVDGGREIQFVNNIINHYAEPFRINSSRGVSIANNLIIRPAIGWTLASAEATAFFDYNVFGAEPSLRASVGQNSVSAEGWMRARMPRSRIIPDADVGDHDLAHVTGFSPTDGGKAIDGLPFHGLAPDIGVAEH